MEAPFFLLFVFFFCLVWFLLHSLILRIFPLNAGVRVCEGCIYLNHLQKTGKE